LPRELVPAVVWPTRPVSRFTPAAKEAFAAGFLVAEEYVGAAAGGEKIFDSVASGVVEKRLLLRVLARSSRARTRRCPARPKGFSMPRDAALESHLSL
jgi:hypothetical protein